MAVTGHALNQLLQQMDRTFSNVTGQSVSFIDQEGHYQGPLRLDVFTGFCRRVISSEKGAQHCLACNHSFGLDAEQRCTVSQCHMGISVISVPVPLPEARGLSLTYGQFLTRDTEKAFYSTLRRHCQELELDYDEMVALAGTLRVLSAEELDARMQMLQVFAGYVATSEAELETRREYARQVEKKLALERTLHASEFKFLQSQISPHFLFNTLNTIASFTRTDPLRARELLREFSSFYRATLDNSGSLIPVSREVAQTKRYLTFEKARFGEDRVLATFDVSEDVEDTLVPAFVIQPIVENAVRHGMGDGDALRIDVTVHQDGDDAILIAVADNGVGMDEGTAARLFDERSARPDASSPQGGGAGVAMHNISERIHRFYGPHSYTRVESAPGKGTKVLLHLDLSESIFDIQE